MDAQFARLRKTIVVWGKATIVTEIKHLNKLETCKQSCWQTEADGELKILFSFLKVFKN